MHVALDNVLPASSSILHLDFLLAQIAESVQLTDTQDAKAREHYTAIADWLDASDSPLAFASPSMYPQGSMALGTTVKPRSRVEYDLDLVCQFNRRFGSAMEIYEAIYNRLAAHQTYRPLLKRKNRCVCLEYQGDFHLDIIPAVSDLDRGGTSIFVPDCKLEGWTPSNPKGFVSWFKLRASTVSVKKGVRGDAEPLPAQQAAGDKPTLSVAVQLIKRARDVQFNGADRAPRSILLTTLAANHYTGGTSIAATMIDALRGIREQIASAKPSVIEVPNPTNDGENFADGLTAERSAALEHFVAMTEAKLGELLTRRGLDALKSGLEELFGEVPVSVALKKYGAKLSATRDAGRLTYAPEGLGIVTAAGTSYVPKNRYYGE